MPAAGTKSKAPDPESIEVEELELEVPAIGEAVTYVTVDPNTGASEEHAAQITWLGEDEVDLVVFARHARQGRPFQHVPFEGLTEDQSQYWRYPRAPEPEQIDDDESTDPDAQ